MGHFLRSPEFHRTVKVVYTAEVFQFEVLQCHLVSVVIEFFLFIIIFGLENIDIEWWPY